MWQLPQKVWNDIWKVADNGKKIHNPLLRKWFAMDLEEIEKVLEDQSKKLENNNHSSLVVIAYQKVAPLLIENRAITKYLEVGNLPPGWGYFSLRGIVADTGVLPEILDEEEAMRRAELEALDYSSFGLDEKDRADLMPMFRRLVPKSQQLGSDSVPESGAAADRKQGDNEVPESGEFSTDDGLSVNEGSIAGDTGRGGSDA